MRHGSAGRRQRHRGPGGGNNNGNRRPQGNNRMQVFDSNGPEVRIRGTAHQVVEKYMALAKDAASAGDRVIAESYLQHAEHYQRVINSWDDGMPENRQSYQQQPHAQPQGQQQANPGNARSDLSLPASILGGSSNVESKEKTQERTDEFVA